MSATYNWAYKPGITNKYGFTVPITADNIRPNGWCYVAIYGNDATGNGSRLYPFKTITKAVTAGGFTYIVLGSGVYRETAQINSPGIALIGDGDVIIDCSYLNILFISGATVQVYNLVVKGDGSSSLTNGYYTQLAYDVIFDGASYVAALGYMGDGNIKNVIFKNISVIVKFGLTDQTYSNVTYFNCNNVDVQDDTRIITRNIIFSNCNICGAPPTISKLQYCLFYQCNFKFAKGSGGGVLYPYVPNEYSYYSTIGALQAAFLAAFSTTSFYGSTIADPLFNNSAIGDLSLSFNSPAKNLSYFGTYVGARSIAYPIKISATESLGVFEFASSVNLTIANDSITLTNPALDAQIDTNVIVNSLGRELANFSSFGFNSDRNGQYIDSIADLDMVTKSAGDTLIIPASYLVEAGAIVYNGNTYTAGNRFTTAAGETTFTTGSSGVLREILEAPQRHTIMARFSDGGTTITAGNTLTIGYYYYVETGSITYNGIIYNAGSTFKAIDANAFSGSSKVIIAFSTEAYQHYEPGIKPTSNNVGNANTGAIIRGNGDPAYVRGGLGIQEFPINGRFIQIRYYIRTNNLKP